MASFGTGYHFHVTGLTHDPSGFPTERPDEIEAFMEKLKNKEIRNPKDLTMVEEFMMNGADVCIFAAGSVARSARQAVKMLRRHNIRAGLLRPQIVWPFPKRPVEEMLERVDFVLVPEMNVGQLRKEVERLSKDRRHTIKGLNVLNSSMITAEQIVDRVLAFEFKPRSARRGRVYA